MQYTFCSVYVSTESYILYHHEIFQSTSQAVNYQTFVLKNSQNSPHFFVCLVNSHIFWVHLHLNRHIIYNHLAILHFRCHKQVKTSTFRASFSPGRLFNAENELKSRMTYIRLFIQTDQNSKNEIKKTEHTRRFTGIITQLLIMQFLLHYEELPYIYSSVIPHYIYPAVMD